MYGKYIGILTKLKSSMVGSLNYGIIQDIFYNLAIPKNILFIYSILNEEDFKYALTNWTCSMNSSMLNRTHNRTHKRKNSRLTSQKTIKYVVMKKVYKKSSYKNEEEYYMMMSNIDMIMIGLIENNYKYHGSYLDMFNIPVKLTKYLCSCKTVKNHYLKNVIVKGIEFMMNDEKMSKSIREYIEKDDWKLLRYLVRKKRLGLVNLLIDGLNILEDEFMLKQNKFSME